MLSELGRFNSKLIIDLKQVLTIKKCLLYTLKNDSPNIFNEILFDNDFIKIGR